MHLFHKYRVVDVEHLKTTQHAIYDRLAGNYIQLGVPIEGKITRLFKKCACGKVKTEEIEGIWPLNNFTK
jgi:hypothetical protein